MIVHAICNWQKLCLCFLTQILVLIFILKFSSILRNSLCFSERNSVIFSNFRLGFWCIFLKVPHHKFFIFHILLSFSNVWPHLYLLRTAIPESNFEFSRTFKIYPYWSGGFGEMPWCDGGLTFRWKAPAWGTMMKCCLRVINRFVHLLKDFLFYYCT